MKLHASLIHEREEKLFKISFVFASIFWFVVIFLTLGVGLFYTAIVLIFTEISKYLFFARVKGFGIQVGENQYPHIYKLAKEAYQDMSGGKLPEIYVLNMDGILNAFAARSISRKYVILSSQALHASEGDDQALGFIVAHELAHHLRKHNEWNTLFLPTRMLPWLSLAYSRSCEYTCDAYGAMYGARNLEKAKLGVSLLATASLSDSKKLASEPLILQAASVATFWGGVAFTQSTHPFTSMRYARIEKLFGDEGVKLYKPTFISQLLTPLFNPFAWIAIFYVSFIGAFTVLALNKSQAPSATENFQNVFSPYNMESLGEYTPADSNGSTSSE